MEADTPRKEALKWVPTCKDSFGMPVVMRKAERFWEEFEEWKRLGGNGRTGGDEDEDESGWDSEGEDEGSCDLEGEGLWAFSKSLFRQPHTLASASEALRAPPCVELPCVELPCVEMPALKRTIT
ncbi:hypothetical protein K432DRAFT_412368 [Lepidopterella palustris CBS 459.81]|uniref:Uncharacterized protein n=1 Tax=Lepidopterella palustris CBS 459.81 TaxID=1314670 RepID=A0A8E2DVQ5_9PEZI|nr:hypothetical protein K432DRAFT_412368 [Lepidopterella palustris CBS 459.81]